MTSEKIYQLMQEKGINGAMIADALSVTPAHISNVITRKIRSRRVALAVSEAIDTSFTLAFPDYQEEKTSIIREKKVSDLRKRFAKLSQA